MQQTAIVHSLIKWLDKSCSLESFVLHYEFPLDNWSKPSEVNESLSVASSTICKITARPTERHGGYDAPKWHVHGYPMCQQVVSEPVITTFCLWRGEYFKGGVPTSSNSGLNSDEQSQSERMVGAESSWLWEHFQVKKYGMERYHGRKRVAGAVRHEVPVSLVASFCSPGPLAWQKRTAGSVEAGAVAPLAIPLALT